MRRRPQGSNRSSASRPTSRRAQRSERSRVSWGSPDQKSDDVSGGGAYTHMTMCREQRGHAQPVPPQLAVEHRGVLLQARTSTVSSSRRMRKGVIATTGCPSGEIQTRLRLGQYEEARQAAAEYQDIFGKENYFTEIMEHGLEIERRVREDLLKISKTWRSRSSRRTTPTTRTSRMRRRTKRCSACSRDPVSTTRTASSSMATATTSSRPPRCVRSSASTPSRATTRC